MSRNKVKVGLKLTKKLILYSFILSTTSLRLHQFKGILNYSNRKVAIWLGCYWMKYFLSWTVIEVQPLITWCFQMNQNKKIDVIWARPLWCCSHSIIGTRRSLSLFLCCGNKSAVHCGRGQVKSWTNIETKI